MREIKFRAWDKVDQQFHYIGLTDGETWIDKSWEPLQQYTGLKDCHDKEIYEGDILDNSSGKNNLIVEWGRLGDGENETDCYGWIVPQGLDEWHIKGNIYENEDLLQ